jgi:amino acid transporter
MSNTTESKSNPFSFEFAGWGNATRIEDLDIHPVKIEHLDQEKRHFLGTWQATAICGNDITSSCLYVSALSIAYAGIMAPVALLLVSFTLYLFRKIYAEVGEALPMNGGTYTLLLNTTSKKKAALAASLTILSYIATAVISANESIHYLHTVFQFIPVEIGTILLLSAFAVLSLFGVSDSAKVALGIFILNLGTLGLLILGGFFLLFTDHGVLFENFSLGFSNGNWGEQLFRGFAIALLGISGFESSANFIEEQKESVFPKTLRNMWMAVTVLNPTLCFLALAVFPIAFINSHQNGLLALMAEKSIGKWFAIWVAINAFLVLSGAVLTSYVGIVGLVRRMTLDRCMPQVLLSENKKFMTNHWIILSFLAVCISVFYITEGNIDSLAGVYSLSFLSVMILFGIGNALLKVRRKKLPRKIRASWSSVFVGSALVFVGLLGNFWLNPNGARIFSAYYAVTAGIILLVLMRTAILRFIFLAIRGSLEAAPVESKGISKLIESWISSITAVPVAYFSKGDNLSTLNQAALYVLNNEQTKYLHIIHFYEDINKVSKQIWYQARTIDQIYPQLKIDLVLVKGQLNPVSIQKISERLNIAKNRMFIGTPGHSFPHRVESLGGVRVII